MNKAFIVFICFAMVALAAAVSADTLMLKDGRVLSGVYIKGTASAIEFEVDGSINTYPLESIISLTFQRSAPQVNPKPATPPPQSKSSPKTATPGAFTIGAGTQLMVRTETDLITGKVKAGDRFTALLEANLVVNGQVIAARGSAVYGRVAESKKAKRIRGVAKLVLELTDIMIGGQLYPIVTDQFGDEGQKSGTLMKFAVGAATGAVVECKDGAKTGAAVGAGVAVLTKGRQISVPAKSLLAFRITQTLQIAG